MDKNKIMWLKRDAEEANVTQPYAEEENVTQHDAEEENVTQNMKKLLHENLTQWKKIMCHQKWRRIRSRDA
jgi:hypothetical protein